METVLVFGATGNIGSEVVRALAEKSGLTVRVASRDVERAAAAFQGATNVHPVRLDWQQIESIDAAMTGVDRLVIINPLSHDMDEQTRALLAAGRRAGIKQVLRFSLMGAGEPDPIEEARWHDAADQVVREGGIPWVILKPNQYFQNFAGPGAVRTVRSAGSLYLPYADCRVSNIDTRDLGEIAARILSDPPQQHAGQQYVLTGAAAQTMDEIAADIGAALGKQVRYVAVPEDAARQAMTQAGMPAQTVEVILGWIAYCRAGRAARVEESATVILGRTPRGSLDFARANAHRYQ